MSLKTKLLISLLPLAVALATVSGISISTIARLGGHSQMILKDNYRSILAAEKMKESIERMDSAALFVIAGHRSEAEDLAGTHRRMFEAELKVQEGNITEPAEKEVTARLREVWTAYQDRYDRFLSVTHPEKEKEDYFVSLYPAFRAVKEAAEAVLILNQKAMVGKSDHVKQFSVRMNRMMFWSAAGFFLAGLVLSVLLVQGSLRPVAILSDAIRRVGKGDLDARAAVAGKDEIAGLARDFNAMAESLCEYRRSSLGALVKAKQISQAAMDRLHEAVLFFDREGHLIDANREAEAILGPIVQGDKVELPADLDMSVKTTFNRVWVLVVGNASVENVRPVNEEVVLKGKEGESAYFLTARPLFTREGDLLGVGVTLRRSEAGARSVPAGEERLADLVEELRTPLTSLYLALSLSLEQTVGALNQKQVYLLTVARDECRRVQAWIENTFGKTGPDADGAGKTRPGA
jgi:two-component system, NtrC family, sensor histidine kinase KinB